MALARQGVVARLFSGMLAWQQPHACLSSNRLRLNEAMSAALGRQDNGCRLQPVAGRCGTIRSSADRNPYMNMGGRAACVMTVPRNWYPLSISKIATSGARHIPSAPRIFRAGLAGSPVALASSRSSAGSRHLMLRSRHLLHRVCNIQASGRCCPARLRIGRRVTGDAAGIHSVEALSFP